MEETVNIFNELKELGCGFLANVEKKNIYTVPELYFDDLAGNIACNIWLQSFSPIMPYTIPEKYFENFPQLLLEKLNVQFIDSLAAGNILYQLPDNYFDTLAGNILQKIKTAKVDSVQEELEEIAPLLSKLPKSNVYTVPAGYFENQVTVPQKFPAKVISIASKPRKWFRYAAAACITAIMFLGGYFYFVNKTGNSVQRQIADINVNKAVSQLPDSALDNYLTGDNSDIYANQSSDEQDLNIQNLISNTSDEDIENYLQQNPDTDDGSKGI